jgi:uncharacterized protein YbjT (DUF2867 family)
MSIEKNDTILVTGATGKVGRRLVARLREAGHEVRAVSRSTAIRFDWQDQSTWAAALAGVDAAYLIPPDEPIPAEALVAAAVEAGVRRLVSQSGRHIEVLADAVGVGPEAIGMYGLQEAVRASGVEWTVLQANNFNENFSEGDFLGPIRAGELALPVEGTLEPFIAVDDIAAVAAAVLTEDGHHGRIYELTGPEALAFAEAIAVIAKASGRSIAFGIVTPEDYAAALRAEGLPEDLVFFLDAMYRIIREGALTEVAGGVKEVLGREPVAFADWAARTAASGAWND